MSHVTGSLKRDAPSKPTTLVGNNSIRDVPLSTHDGSTLRLTVTPHRVSSVPLAGPLARAGAGEVALVTLHVECVSTFQNVTW